MAVSVLETIGKTVDFEKLDILEQNIRKNDALSADVESALRGQYASLGRELVASRTNLDMDDLSDAEEKIVEAVARYVGLQKREGKTANRTFRMIANRGLIEAAEISVMKSKPTQGFEVLEEADLEELSFEQIIVDHPDDFSPRALWYARKTLGIPNDSEKPPASDKLITQIRTEELINWLKERAISGEGNLTGYTNIDVGQVLGFSDLTQYGRVLGNITSRIDFACYRCGLPPLGLVAETPFANAWLQQDRSWAFPVSEMATAAQGRRWSETELDQVLAASRELPGTASIPWKKEIREHERSVRDWAFGLTASENGTPPAPTDVSDEIANIAKLERKALRETPKEKLKISRSIERGPIGQAVKKANGYKCQICEALGKEPHSFLKTNGVPYVEAHHVTPVSEMQIGSLAASNIMTVCANHHRQLHYGDVSVEICDKTFEITIDDHPISVERFSFLQ